MVLILWCDNGIYSLITGALQITYDPDLICPKKMIDSDSITQFRWP